MSATTTLARASRCPWLRALSGLLGTALALGSGAASVAPLGAACAVVALVAPTAAAAFSFHEEEEQDRHAEERAQRRSRSGSESAGIGAACRAEIARRRTVVVIAERTTAGGLRTEQSVYGAHVQALNRALRGLNVRTYTQEEIRAQIAQAEIDAYFRNDPDAALAASHKLGADLVVRGVISSRSAFNVFMGIPEVAVTIALTLADKSGRTVAEAGVSADSYSGYDTLGMALRLVDEQAPAVVATLLDGYCRAPSASHPDG